MSFLCDSNSTPLVSVIMPAYNAERYIGEAIKSVQSQNYNNLEIIVVDDCSRDGTRSIVKSIAKDDARVIMIELAQNAGVANARNVGVAEARGQYIALLDSDDLWEPQKLDYQVALLNKTNAQITYCSYGLIDALGNPAGRDFVVSSHANFRSMLARNEMGCSTICADARLLKAHPFNGGFQHEDYLLWMELLREGAVAVGSPTVLAYYRLHDENRSGDKIAAARHRWDVYRRGLKMPLLESSWAFFRYALNGMRKYV